MSEHYTESQVNQIEQDAHDGAILEAGKEWERQCDEFNSREYELESRIAELEARAEKAEAIVEKLIEAGRMMKQPETIEEFHRGRRDYNALVAELEGESEMVNTVVINYQHVERMKLTNETTVYVQFASGTTRIFEFIEPTLPAKMIVAFENWLDQRHQYGGYVVKISQDGKASGKQCLK